MNWRDLPPLSSLRAFAAYAEGGSLQAAGDALSVSHAAISQQIRNLEAHLGRNLLDRTGRKAELTNDGRALALALDEGFSQIAECIARLTGAENARALVVSTTPSFAAGWLMPRLSEFRQKHPQIDVVCDARTDLVDFARGEADIAIRFGTGTWPNLDAHHLLATRMIAVAAPELLPEGAKVDIHALRKLPVLQESGTSENTLWLDRHGLSEAGGGGRLELPGYLTLDAARAGQGIAVTASVWVEADLEAGRLVELFSDPQPFGYFAVTRAGVHRPALKAFLKWLKTRTDA